MRVQKRKERRIKSQFESAEDQGNHLQELSKGWGLVPLFSLFQKHIFHGTDYTLRSSGTLKYTTVTL